MKSSETLSALAKALVSAQKDLKHAALDSTNPHFRSKYASLASIIDTVRPALAKHALAVIQVVQVEEVETVLVHEGGEWISSSCKIVADKPGPQALGSAITYARRYGLAALVCISAEEDDDGNGAEKKFSQEERAVFDRPAPRSEPRPDPVREAFNGTPVSSAPRDAKPVDAKPSIKDPDSPATDKQIKMIHAKAKALEATAEIMHDLMMKIAGKKSSSELTKGDASAIIEKMMECNDAYALWEFTK